MSNNRFGDERGIQSILMHYSSKYDPVVEIMWFHDYGINVDSLKDLESKAIEVEIEKLPKWKKKVLGLI